MSPREPVLDSKRFDALEKGTLYVTYFGPADRWGRYHFELLGWEEDFHTGPTWRGQHYMADPGPYIERVRKAGLTIAETPPR